MRQSRSAHLADRCAAWLRDGSCMSREAHVQFCESLGVRFPGATHLVICCRVGAEQALTAMRRMMSTLKWTVNENKTRVCHLPKEKFDFLGYTFGRCYSAKTGRAYLGTTPSKKRVQRLCKSISEMTAGVKLSRTLVRW